MGFMYGSPDSAGSLGLLLSSSNNKKEYNADKNKIVLTIDGEQYPLAILDQWLEILGGMPFGKMQQIQMLI